MVAALKRYNKLGLFGKSRSMEKTVACLADGKANVPYTVKAIETEDQAMKDFLFTLGCYVGEEITIISRLADNIVVSIKDARYSINTELAKVIAV